jgi:16S rRNA (cytosine967-C5)-methyltransferase
MGRPPSSRRGGRVNPGRQGALRALLRVERGERSDRALEAEAPPSGRDRALAWHLVSGVLQHRGEIDHILAASSKRPLGALDPAVVAVLRLAIYELRHGRAPARAVVHQAVELTRVEASRRATGFVNAVLRNQGRVGEPPERVLLNHPDWLLERWSERYGVERAARWALRNNQPAPLCLASLDGPEALEAELLEAGLTPARADAGGRAIPGLRAVEGPVGQVGALSGIQQGRWWVQDPAAAAVADLVGCEPGWRVLDACAAPGGKTFRLLSQGGELVAVDRAPERLERMAGALRRLQLEARLVLHDWLEGPLAGQELFDAVLVDAPCSGLGTLRRHPEIRWRRQPEDLVRNAARQLEILRACAPHVRPGGVLVYAVCSGEPEEGERVVEGFLSHAADFEVDDRFCSAPPVGDEDAFQAIRLLRR